MNEEDKILLAFLVLSPLWPLFVLIALICMAMYFKMEGSGE
jgi:hypothetical protein